MTEEQGKNSKKKLPSAATRMVWYVTGEEETPLFLDQHDTPHALVDGEALPISGCNNYLRRVFYDREREAVANDACLSARGTLAMLARDSGDRRTLHTRACYHEGAVFYQLGPGRVLKIDENGWALDPDPPVTFRSVKNLKEMPTPKKGGDLGGLTRWVNLKTEKDARLYKTWVTLVPLADIPRPILQLTGVQGSGKTTAGRIPKRLMDPTSPETVSLDRRDFLQKAAHCYLMMLDNQNSLPGWSQDHLCRLVTGESDSKRQLYSDDEDIVWEMKLAVILNGINPPGERGDLQDRTLPIELERVTKNDRMTEEDIWLKFDLQRPELLGAVFDALSGALRERESVTLAELPRLADWGLYAAALYKSQGWGVGKFKEDWKGVEEAQHQGTLDGSIVAQVVILFMLDKERVELPASRLHAALESFAEDHMDLTRDRDWPKTGRTLWNRIKEVMPLLESYGIKACRELSNKQGRRIILERIKPGGGDDDPDRPLSDNLKPGESATFEELRKTREQGDDNPTGDDKGDDNPAASSPEKPHGDAPEDDNGSGGRYFGDTVGNSPSNNGGSETGPYSNPDLSSPSSPNGANGVFNGVGKVVYVRGSHAYDVYVGRAMPPSKTHPALAKSEFANPYKKGRGGDLETVIEKFRHDLEHRIEADDAYADRVRGLAGKTLACWCNKPKDAVLLPDDPLRCHAQILLRVANRLADAENGEAEEAEQTPRKKRRLTEEEAQKVQRLTSQGMKAEFARREVVGEEA